MDIYNNKLKIIMMIIILFLLNSCNFKDKDLCKRVQCEHEKSGAIKKQDERKEPNDSKTPVQILLDGFNFSDEYKEAVLYIQKALTDPNVGSPDDKIYTDAEFYDLLVKLGKDRLENCAKVTLLTFRVRKGAVDAIASLKDQAKKDELNTELAAIDANYFDCLKLIGNGDTVDQIYSSVINHDDGYKFEIIKDTAHALFLDEMRQRVP
ncbi:BTA121 domain-containing protein surface lipoprotein [Borrelia hermsii]|uniref:Uncharacterized protein n=2 Tax=Borrelia hermsii TaxID=140 RepID=A0AAN0X7P6_BORHE|nr:hypothetical protein [Borrelia hermsii]AMR75938.1 hypothetical protein A0V01_04825 [Borrelia hermsii]ANA43745.1 hypothetical protein AXX13_A0515 [Borrelia hermsii HS1]UCP01969.1 hypothetical protein K9R62_04860 [Borrelia hermsii]UPA08536.1 hypothetical protein bhDAH_001247 [Borrelia hermsii DAH]